MRREVFQAIAERPASKREAACHGRTVCGDARAARGYYLVDAKDLDEGIDIASRVPVVRLGTIEARPVLEISGLPEKPK